MLNLIATFSILLNLVLIFIVIIIGAHFYFSVRNGQESNRLLEYYLKRMVEQEGRINVLRDTNNLLYRRVNRAKAGLKGKGKTRSFLSIDK